MTYPIFNSVINRIENELNKRDVALKTFKTWNEDRINATGLEIVIDLSGKSHFLKALSINFDWDRFRETVLARQLKGMEEHPFLQEDNMVSTTISPIIDIEVSWLFDEQKSQPQVNNYRYENQVEDAGKWMEEIGVKVNKLLKDDDIITRWHVEVEGTENGKYLSAINLISYFQYTFENLNSLNDVHEFVGEKLQELLNKSNRVLKLSEQTLEDLAA